MTPFKWRSFQFTWKSRLEMVFLLSFEKYSTRNFDEKELLKGRLNNDFALGPLINSNFIIRTANEFMF